jgi:hypothetical protein
MSAVSVLESLPPPRLLFTAPWEPILVRRGDALGLGALADRLGDAVAPDFSNRITDGRWLTILAWCLCRSHAVFHKTGRRNVGNRLLARERYMWLRPLELMWVARTILLLEDEANGRPLAGQRRVRRWIDGAQEAPCFAMTPDQFRAYRQTGMYGGYRLAFRKWPHLTRGGDGWTPGVTCTDLAKWLDGKLGGARPKFSDDDVPVSKWSIWKGHEASWWLKYWPEFNAGGKNAEDNTLPRRRTDAGKLPEAHLLQPVVFGPEVAGKRRRLVVKLLSNSNAANHQEAVEHLAHEMKDKEIVQLLPLFACLADAGMELMDAISAMLRKKPAIKLSELAKRSEVQDYCKQLIAASKAWATRKKGVSVRHIETADKFAAKFPGAATRECLIALLDHHEQHGGGLRWFVLRNDEVVARANPLGTSSRYRFRLWPLCRLATQCGVIRAIPSALALDEPEDATELGEA